MRYDRDSHLKIHYENIERGEFSMQYIRENEVF